MVEVVLAMLGEPLDCEGTAVYRRPKCDSVLPFLDTDAQIVWGLYTVDSAADVFHEVQLLAKHRAAYVHGVLNLADTWEDDLGKRDRSEAKGAVISSGRHIIIHRVHVTSLREKDARTLRMDNHTIYPMKLLGVPVKRILLFKFYE